MIDLGLKRIAQLVQPSTLPWKAIHVAGTNGKGSVCAYLTSCLNAAGVPVGSFTSPHLVDRWDCISLQNRPVTRAVFFEAESKVQETNERLGIGASEFELLTATAFEVFSQAGVEVGVVEVGLGGSDDATNVLAPENVLVSVVTKIGLDHQAFLGDTLEAIASVKAGIAKRGIPMVVDASNPTSVLEVVRKAVADVEGGDVFLAAPEPAVEGGEGCETVTPAFGRLHFPTLLPGSFQPHNLSCAVNALSAIAPRFPALTPTMVVDAVARTRWPGRLEHVDCSPLYPNSVALLDGAHNPQAQRELRKYVDEHIRPRTENGKVWWVLAATKGKDVDAMVRELMRPEDGVIATRFGAVGGMPWINSVDTADIMKCARKVAAHPELAHIFEHWDPALAVTEACRRVEDLGGAVVVAGSLYLVGDVHRALRKKTRRNPFLDHTAT